MEIQPVSPKGNQSWIFIGRTDAEAEVPILCPPYVKSQLIGKDPDAGKDWRQEEKGVTEDEMVGWHHWLNRHEFEETLGDSKGQGGLACCSPWGSQRVRNDWLNNNKIYGKSISSEWFKRFSSSRWSSHLGSFCLALWHALRVCSWQPVQK